MPRKVFVFKFEKKKTPREVIGRAFAENKWKHSHQSQKQPSRMWEKLAHCITKSFCSRSCEMHLSVLSSPSSAPQLIPRSAQGWFIHILAQSPRAQKTPLPCRRSSGSLIPVKDARVVDSVLANWKKFSTEVLQHEETICGSAFEEYTLNGSVMHSC